MQTKKLKGSKCFNIKNDCYSYFLKDISKYDTITSDEEEELFYRYKKGDKQAYNKIILSNLRFVVFIAKNISKNKENLLDLINQGNIGLILAIDKFDITKGVKFITFAVHYIQREMMNYISNIEPSVRITNVNKTFHVKNKIESSFYTKEGRFPTSEELLEIINNGYGYNLKNKSDLFKVTFSSVDDMIEDESSDYVINNISKNVINEYENKIETDFKTNLVNNIITKLPKRNRMIIEYLYGIGKDRAYEITEVAEHFNITKERVRQIQKSSIKTMSEFI